MNMPASIAPAQRHCPLPAPDVVQAVAAVLGAPEEALDYAKAKVALDALVDPQADADWTFAELDRLTAAARGLAGPGAGEEEKLRAVRAVIYESGPWNGFRPFAYDHEDCTSSKARLLSHYLKSGRGNCVPMPILFLILAHRLGLNVALVCAPNHFFIRYTSPEGIAFDLETTSGASPARLEWFRQEMPMSDRALANGLYMRSLPLREAIAMMAFTNAWELAAQRRWGEAAELCGLVLRIYPRTVWALVAAGSAYGQMFKEEFADRLPDLFLIPQHLLPRRLMLMERNHSLISAAEHLGWEPADLDME